MRLGGSKLFVWNNYFHLSYHHSYLRVENEKKNLIPANTNRYYILLLSLLYMASSSRLPCGLAWLIL